MEIVENDHIFRNPVVSSSTFFRPNESPIVAYDSMRIPGGGIYSRGSVVDQDALVATLEGTTSQALGWTSSKRSRFSRSHRCGTSRKVSPRHTRMVTNRYHLGTVELVAENYDGIGRVTRSRIASLEEGELAGDAS